jgi:hypothetical protein
MPQTSATERLVSELRADLESEEEGEEVPLATIEYQMTDMRLQGGHR